MPDLKLLLVAATPMESAMLRSLWDLPLTLPGEMVAVNWEGLELSLLHTGIGMVNAAWHLGRTFQAHSFDAALQFGIGGAFPGGPEMLEVVEVVEDCFAELGADSPGGFLGLEQMGFAHFEHGGERYYNRLTQPRPAMGSLRACRAITVNRVSGTTEGIAQMQQIWNPEVESMEGAAFFQACILAHVRFRAFRTISNVVEPRNREAWKLKEALETAQMHMLETLKEKGMEL